MARLGSGAGVALVAAGASGACAELHQVCSRAQPCAPPRRNSWVGTSWLLLTDILGTSVLTLPGVAKQLGWILTIVLIVLGSPMSVYSAVLMSKTRSMMKLALNRDPLTMGEAARYLLGGESAAKLVYGIVYGFLFLGNGTYLLTIGQALQGTFYDLDMCLPTAVFVSAACCVPVVAAVRHLSDSIAICFGNLFLNIAVLAIVMTKLAMDGRREDVQTFWFAEDLSMLSVCGAATLIIFSYTGQVVYFEIMSEMTHPEHFPRVFMINAPLQTVLYLVVALWGYYFSGDKAKGYFLDNLPLGAAYRWASALLLVHVCIAFIIKNVIICRHAHRILSPTRVDVRLGEQGGARAHAEYVVCALVGLFGGALVANAIPFFSEFLSLLGGLLSGPISFALPIMFYYGARRAFRAWKDEGQANASPAPADSERQATACETRDVAANAPSEERISRAALSRGLGQDMPIFDAVVCAVILTCVALTMVVGTASAVKDIMALTSVAPPFSCERLSRT